MRAQQVLLITLALPLSHAAETILGVYIFSRHGDRTAKSTPPANLTELGYEEVFTSGTYFRNRYVASNATSRIAGINSDLVRQSQITASAPLDTVLMNSAQGFLQGLYPPVGSIRGSTPLRNGTTVQTPLNGYQLIPLQTVTSGTGSEDSAWLQGSSNCAKALVSSNGYYTSPEYTNLLTTTADFYKSLSPLVNNTFSLNDVSFKNAYTSKLFLLRPYHLLTRTDSLLPVYDLLNVASIHNSTISFPPSDLYTPSSALQARTLADTHEWNLAYNVSDSIRAITGATLAGQVLQALNNTITGAGKSKINIQFGAYAGFQSFFGLAQLPQVNADFYGVPDYTSTMTFELFTNGPATPFPAAADINVRFLFHNGTTSPASEPKTYPLFGQQETTIPWNTFVDSMNKFAIGSQAQWCQACGNSTAVCATVAKNPTSSRQADASSSGGLSTAVAGVIGAMVTLAVILGLEALVMLVAGLRLVSKKRLAAPVEGSLGGKA